MNKSASYIYFALTGDDFDPAEITARLGVEPTATWKKGDKNQYNFRRTFACWKWETVEGKEPIFIDNLVEEVVAKLEDKIEIIVELKQQFELNSVLEIVLWVDINEKQSTPALGHNLRTIDFLYHTQTVTDVDIYRYDSSLPEH